MPSPQRPHFLRAFGEAVRRARLSAGLSQEQLAESADLDRTYIGGVERGERNASLLAVHKIAQGLQLSLSELFAQVDASLKEDEEC